MEPRSGVGRPLGDVVNGPPVKSVGSALDIWIVIIFAIAIFNGVAFAATMDWDKLLIALLLAYAGVAELDDKLEERPS